VLIFCERYMLTALGGAITLDPVKWDWQRRISFLVLIVAAAYFVGHTLAFQKAAPDPIATRRSP
jgi:hypothetical protein